MLRGRRPRGDRDRASDGTPNVTHLTRVHLVDDERVAVSNQFFSKTVRNLAENPQACVLLIDPIAYHEYRLILRYERTERRGPLFDQLHRDVEAVAALTGHAGRVQAAQRGRLPRHRDRRHPPVAPRRRRPLA